MPHTAGVDSGVVCVFLIVLKVTLTKSSIRWCTNWHIKGPASLWPRALHYITISMGGVLGVRCCRDKQLTLQTAPYPACTLTTRWGIFLLSLMVCKPAFISLFKEICHHCRFTACFKSIKGSDLSICSCFNTC
jgi:hypothetical protein